MRSKRWVNMYGSSTYETTDWLTEPKEQIGLSTEDGNPPVYEGMWFNENTKKGDIIGYEEKTQYQYRDFVRKFVWTEWSDWGQENDFAASLLITSEDHEVKNRTLFRYRKRSKTGIYIKKGEWSEYSEEKVEPTDTREVREITVYRYLQ